MSQDLKREDLVRPIVGIENRTAQEVFDIMCGRFRLSLQAEGAPAASGCTCHPDFTSQGSPLEGPCEHCSTPAAEGKEDLDRRTINALYAIAFENRQNASAAANMERWDHVIGWLANVFDAALPHPAPAAEPVAWRGRPGRNHPWKHTGDAIQAEQWAKGGYEVRWLYDRPQQPVAISREEIERVVRVLSNSEISEPTRIVDARDGLIAILSKLSGRAS